MSKSAITHPARHAAYVLLSTAAMAFAATAAHAAGDSITQQKTVRYADLDLSNQEGAARLYSRLKAAARDVCGVAPERDLKLRGLYQDCYSKALGAAVEDVNHVSLTALHGSGNRYRVASVD